MPPSNVIEGLPAGAVVTPISSASQSAPDFSQVQGLPAGAVVTPITSDTSAAPDTSTPAPGTTGVAGFLNKIGEGTAEGARDIYGVVKGMVPGGNAETGAAKTIWSQLPPVQLADSVKQILPLVQTYEKSRAGGASVSDSIAAVNETAKQHTSNIVNIKPVVDAFRANPTRETARALTDAAALAASMFVGNEAAPEEAAAATTAKAAPTVAPAAESEGLMTRLTNPFRTTPQTVPGVVGKITQAVGPDVETAAKALQSVDTTGVKTFQDLENTLDAQIRANTAKVDESLSQNATPYKPAEVETRIPVAGKTDIVTSPVNDALDQLHDYYLKTKDATGQAQIESLQTKFESQGLTTKELNDLARLHGKDLNAYNANGELASGLTKQAAENTRMGVKDLVRKLTPDDATRALDKNTSDLIATRQMASDMSAKVQTLQNRLEKAGLWRKAASAAATGTDIVTGGFFKNLVGLAKSGDQTLNAIQIENNLRKNLALLDRLNTMSPQAAFQTLKSLIPATAKTAAVVPGDSGQ